MSGLTEKQKEYVNIYNQRKIDNEKYLKEELEIEKKETLKEDILKNIDNYKDYKICPSCKGSKGNDIQVECSYEEMDYYSDGDYYFMSFENCSKCVGLGYIKKGNKNGH